MNTVLVTFFCLLPVIIAHGFDANVSNCPPEDAIKPCTCRSIRREISCSGLLNSDDLRKVFKNFAGGNYIELVIDSSTMQYIPHDIFEGVKLRVITVKNSTLVDLFNAPPTSPSAIIRIHIENSKLLRTSWNHLATLTYLSDLRIDDTSIRVLDETFGRSLPKGMKYISLRGTETRTIKAGAFHGIDNIISISVKNAGLSTLRRDMFPVPFYGYNLFFMENKLTTLPKGLFKEMPNLKNVDLRVNELTEVPEEAFDENASQLEHILLDVNPLNCDCALKWIVTNGPEVRSGTCESPVEMKEKRLSQLTADDFDC
ncbi:slit homolog 3 protein-like [Uloborus diversus]|uniref:slit homolog 3 protein-like n=1 Tax=Uloborus diversus TaxID=327109 RepID=UPI00240939A2|nr:slit homolog 3 protein-like [Uloborus diversus]